MADQLLLTLTGDPLIERRATRVADALGLERHSLPVSAADPLSPELPEAESACGLVVELERDGAVELVRVWRERWPELAIVAYLSSPQPELWREAELAGADAVCTRGRLDRVLSECLTDRLSGRRRSRRLRLAPLSEFAGRLGFVGRTEDSPVGPVGVYHLNGRLYAISDACPHDGAPLSEGELDGEVVTCPRHGSQFCVRDGERLRGPADRDVGRFPVVIEAGVAFLELPL
jgi:nitrite reductase/ring-hydroxylating ferredoxin subunit